MAVEGENPAASPPLDPPDKLQRDTVRCEAAGQRSRGAVSSPCEDVGGAFLAESRRILDSKRG